MSYQAKTDWKYDETVNEGDLNRIEQGVKEAHEKASDNEQTFATHLRPDMTNAHNITNITGLQTTLDGKESILAANQKRPIYIQSTAPANPKENDIWIEV